MGSQKSDMTSWLNNDTYIKHGLWWRFYGREWGKDYLFPSSISGARTTNGTMVSYKARLSRWKKITQPCDTLSCSLTLWPQGDPDWPTDSTAGVWGAWGHRRCSPGAGTGGNLRAGLQLREHWGDRQPGGGDTVPCAFQWHECTASGGFLRNIVKLVWVCSRSL